MSVVLVLIIVVNMQPALILFRLTTAHAFLGIVVMVIFAKVRICLHVYMQMLLFVIIINL